MGSWLTIQRECQFSISCLGAYINLVHSLDHHHRGSYFCWQGLGAAVRMLSPMHAVMAWWPKKAVFWGAARWPPSPPAATPTRQVILGLVLSETKLAVICREGSPDIMTNGASCFFLMKMIATTWWDLAIQAFPLILFVGLQEVPLRTWSATWASLSAKSPLGCPDLSWIASLMTIWRRLRWHLQGCFPLLERRGCAGDRHGVVRKWRAPDGIMLAGLNQHVLCQFVVKSILKI